MQAIHTKYKNRSSCLGSNTKLYSKNRSNNTPTGIFSKISRARSMFLFFSVILASMILKVRSMFFGRTFVAFPRYAFLILAFLATISVFGFSASVFADSSSSAVYGDEGSVENSSNFSVTVEELNALELRLSASDLVLDLNPTSDAPVFGSSDLSVTVYTTNTTGYYLTMTPTTTNLTRTEALNGNYPTIATLASAVAPSTFSSTSDTTTANKWGYKVNTTNLSTIDTTNYNPAVTTAVPLNKTTAPLANGDETDITFAAKVDADTVAGSYKTTLSFTAVTNANTYSITFNPGSASSDASLVSMPSPNPQTGALESGSSTSITISSSTPTRAGYSFLGWCSVAPTTSNNTDSCTNAIDGSGTTYQPGGSITIYTDTPDITLYAMWGINSYAITITNSNTSSNVNSLTIPYGGSAMVTVTPDSNYYLSDVSCPSGYTCSGYSTGTGYTSQQTVTVTNNGTTSGGTLSFTGTVSGYTVSFNANGGTSTPSSEFTTSSVTLPSAISYHTASTTNTSTTYATFAGWNTAPDGSGTTYSAGSSYTPTADTTLYATWNFNSGTLQGAAESSAASCGANLVDARTGVSYLTYTISGKCYMEQNLYLPTGFTLYAGDSNIYSTAASKNQKLSWTTPSSSTMPSNSYDTPYMVTGTYTDNTYNVTGGWYNYCAASAQTVCDNTTKENANSDICPKGWRLPTSAEMGNVASAARFNWKFYAGNYYNGSLQNDSSSSYWWSATEGNRTGQFYLTYYNGSLNINGYYKYYGYFVRCVSDTVAKQPTMQNFSSDDFASMSVGESITLPDSRTGTSYTVKMLSLNGTKTLWMMSNLKLPGGTKLTTSDSNVTADYTLPSDTGSSGWVDDYCKPYMATAGGEYYYNWPAATARTNSTSSTSGGCSNDTGNSVGDICPKGWRLPVYSGEADKPAWLSGVLGSLTTTGNFHSGSQYGVDSYGHWWTSTRYNGNYARLMSFNGSTASGSYNNKYSGSSVRCMRTS